PGDAFARLERSLEDRHAVGRHLEPTGPEDLDVEDDARFERPISRGQGYRFVVEGAGRRPSPDLGVKSGILAFPGGNSCCRMLRERLVREGFADRGAHVRPGVQSSHRVGLFEVEPGWGPFDSNLHRRNRLRNAAWISLVPVEDACQTYPQDEEEGRGAEPLPCRGGKAAPLPSFPMAAGAPA